MIHTYIDILYTYTHNRVHTITLYMHTYYTHTHPYIVYTHYGRKHYEKKNVELYIVHLAIDNVKTEEYFAKRSAAEPPDDTVLSTTYVIMFERIGDIRHFA